jgi:hypothetical protein
MIFSFEQLPATDIEFSLEKTDIFCFFHSEKAVFVPRDSWVTAVCASLKMKKNVLLLESHREQPPVVNQSQRWEVGEDYLWIAPRALSVLIKAANENSDSYPDIKIHLGTFK